MSARLELTLQYLGFVFERYTEPGKCVLQHLYLYVISQNIFIQYIFRLKSLFFIYRENIYQLFTPTWIGVGMWTFSVNSVHLKVALSRIPALQVSLLCCTVTPINAFFQWTSQSTRCYSADRRYTQQSHRNNQLSLTTSTNLCGMSQGKDFKAFCGSMLSLKPQLPFLMKNPAGSNCNY